ncbi:MAG: pyruvate kinase [Vicinamibacteria bacterium]
MPIIPPRVLNRLASALTELRTSAMELEASHAAPILRSCPEHRQSARNLVHYLALRQHDIRPLQEDLGELGLSSLGRLEGHTLATLNSVLALIGKSAGRAARLAGAGPAGISPRAAARLLAEHSQLLLGAPPVGRVARIMVTMPSEAARDFGVVRDLVAAGMNVMRINCAHDEPDDWRAMVVHLRRAERELGVSCRVQADLPGPKLRTGLIAPFARMAKLKPKRDALGRTQAPARVWLTPAGHPAPAPDGLQTVRVTGTLLASSREGDFLIVADARARHRTLSIVESLGRSRVAETNRTIYLAEGAALTLRRGDSRIIELARAEGLGELMLPLVLREGDILMLTRADTPGEPAREDPHHEMAVPAHIPCSSPEAFDSVKPGHRVFLDDGRIGGVVTDNNGQEMRVSITQVPDPKGAKLRAEKGINFPDTEMGGACLTPRDIAALEVVAPLVDMVALSFVQHPSDLDLLHEHLRRLAVPNLGVVLKVETRAAFENLPLLLLAALRWPSVGVMVARGDLGVEVGFERLSEIQEEILWLCEAAHLPVIWATQVLEGMAKTGSPTRAEVTDAAMSGRAECVMLNKGPHIVATVKFLSRVLDRMDGHQSKKTPMLRRLSISENLGPAKRTRRGRSH